MVILKINAGTPLEREVEIVNEAGTWANGNYHLFTAHFLKKGSNAPEPHDINSPNFLGEIAINKEKASWNYNGDNLNSDEQKEVADFIIDYKAPDGVY
jgi:hypothetical protein